MATETIFFNQVFDKKRLKVLITWVFKEFGEKQALRVVEELKRIGYSNATQAGLSIGLNDLTTPVQKASLLSKAELNMSICDQDFNGGRITATERNQRIVDTWHRVSETLRKQVVDHFSTYDQLNPVYIMALSGARGNFSQVRQLVGMRGLMADPQGQIISFPIRSNLREGLTLTEYFISCSGARKGLVDTALRTADTGYLTRRLVDVSHHIVIKKVCCNTNKGILVKALKSENKILLSLCDRLVGRVLAQNIEYPVNDNRQTEKTELGNKALETHNTNLVAQKNQEICPTLAYKIQMVKDQVMIRSPLTCGLTHSVCQLCYGWSLSQGRLVSLGEAVGVIAAQSIGEPGTQLTMRTFHTGGVFSGDLLQEIRAPHSGRIEFAKAFQGLMIRTTDGQIAFLTKTSGEIILKNNQVVPLLLPNVKNNLFATKVTNIKSKLDLLLKYSLSTRIKSENYYVLLPKIDDNKKKTILLSTIIKVCLFYKYTKNQNKRDTIKINSDSLQEQKQVNTQTCLQFQALSLLFVRQAEYVKKNQLLAQISIFGEEGNQPIKSRQTIFAELSGKVFETQGAVNSKKIIKNIKNLGKNSETNISKHEFIDTLKVCASNSIQPEKSAKLGFFHILATQIGATFDFNSFQTPFYGHSSIDKNYNFDFGLLVAKDKNKVSVPSRQRLNSFQLGQNQGYAGPSFCNAKDKRPLLHTGNLNPRAGKSVFGLLLLTSTKPKIYQRVPKLQTWSNPSKLGLPELHTQTASTFTTKSPQLKSFSNPYTTQFFSSTQNKNLIASLLNGRDYKVKKFKSSQQSHLDPKLQQLSLNSNNANDIDFFTCFCSCFPNPTNKPCSHKAKKHINTFPDQVTSVSLLEKPQNPDCFYLRTIAQEGDLVDSSYKKCVSL